nr:MAG TPA: hypothetical protein [Caudoviricetes sp.]
MSSIFLKIISNSVKKISADFVCGISIQNNIPLCIVLLFILFIILIEIKNSIDLHTIPYLIRFLCTLLYYI